VSTNRYIFQGESGAFGEDALVRAFGPDAERDAAPTFADVFAHVASGDATAGVVPIENSLHGSVLETYDLLLAHDLEVVGEIIVPVNHCLLGRPGTALEDVTIAHSHPQALAQSSAFLAEHRIEPRASSNTAAAARELAWAGEPGHAAIASERAAGIYGLEVLARDIQRSSNTTRFLIVARSDLGCGAPTKVMLAYTTPNEPGALQRSLGVLAQLDVNLSRIESRPTRDTAWEYYFYIDGARADGAAFDPQFLTTLVDALGAVTRDLRMLGTFPAA
jgi:prephenate dehydratase